MLVASGLCAMPTQPVPMPLGSRTFYGQPCLVAARCQLLFSLRFLIEVICRSMGFASGTVSAAPCNFYGGADLCGAPGSQVVHSG